MTLAEYVLRANGTALGSAGSLRSMASRSIGAASFAASRNSPPRRTTPTLARTTKVAGLSARRLDATAAAGVRV